MSDNNELEELKEKVIELEIQVNRLLDHQNSNGFSTVADFFKGFFVVLGALFWIMVLFVVLSIVGDRLSLSNHPLLLCIAVGIVCVIGYLLFFFKKNIRRRNRV